MNKNWQLQKSETDLVYNLGDIYPSAIICNVYEENSLGEKRLVESRTLIINTPVPNSIGGSVE